VVAESITCVRICDAGHWPQMPDAGSILARYTDGQCRPPNQRELWERHAPPTQGEPADVHDVTHQAK
jgi:hypothetical protein